MFFGQHIVHFGGKNVPGLFHQVASIFVEDAVRVVELVANLVGGMGFLSRKDTESQASLLEGLVECWGEDFAVNADLGFLSFDFNEVENAISLAEGFDGRPVYCS